MSITVTFPFLSFLNVRESANSERKLALNIDGAIKVTSNKKPSKNEIRIKENRTSTHINRLLEQGDKKEIAPTGKEIDPIAPAVIAWAEACFAEGSQTTAEDLKSLIKEASDAARTDFDEESARQWANKYVFPSQYLESDEAVIASRMPCKLALARLCSNMLVPV